MSDPIEIVRGVRAGQLPYKYVPVKNTKVAGAAKIIAVHAARTCADAAGEEGGARCAALLADQATALRQAADILDGEAAQIRHALEESEHAAMLAREAEIQAHARERGTTP